MEGNEDKKTILKSIINHTFMLKRLPNKEDPLDVSIGIDLFLLQRLSTAIQHLSETVASVSIKSALELFKSWHKSQKELSSTTEDFLEFPLRSFKSQLENLQENESACLFLRAQNSVIWFTALTDSQIRVISFRGSLNNKSVMSHGGGLLVTYPETEKIIPKSSLLTSDDLMRELKHLCWKTCSVAVEKAHKSGSRPEEVRDPSNPFMITEFISSILNVNPTTEENMSEINNNKTKVTVTKKVRDQVNTNTGTYIPWRRSGLWMCAKAVLQMSLQENAASESEARHHYKLILLQMLTSLCEDYIQAEGYARWDIIHQMIVKLACRISKIERDIPNRIGQVMKMASMLIDQWQKKLSSDWKHICESDGAGGRTGTMTPIKLNEEQLEKYFIHEIPMLKEHLVKNMTTMKLSRLQTSLPDVTPTVLNLSLDHLLSQKLITVNARCDPHLNEETVWIYRVERFARENLIDKNRNFYGVQKTFELLEKYVNFVVPVYGIKNCDPVALSRMTLTVLRFIQFLDKIATLKHSLLREYGCGIGTSIFERLLVCSKREMELASELKRYFTERNASKQRSWIVAGELNCEDFSARYADYHPKLLELKSKILKDMNEKIEKKKVEVCKAKEEYKQLTNELLTAEGLSHHIKNSRRGQIRRSVFWYEKILPPRDFQQNAVVFELGIPEELRCLRDSVLLFKEIVGQTLEGSEFRVREAKIVKKWTEYLGKYPNNYRHAELSKYFTLGSTSKPWFDSHYSKQRKPDVSVARIEEFIQENGMNCIYEIKKCLPAELGWHPSEKMFTFKLSKTLQSERYDSLQFAMSVQRRTENYVLANQYSCHKKLRLREWHSFGSMRSGHKIQLRNLYMALSNKELSMETEPVLALILQTIWEYGPGPGPGHNPEIYVDFQDENFALEFLLFLNKIREENCSNWSSPLIYLTLTVIAIRILEVNNLRSATVMKEAARCIKQIRGTLNKWSEKLESLISQKQTHQNSKGDTGDLLVILTQISLCSAFTFNVSSRSHMEHLITSDEDVKYWLQTLYRLNYLVNRERISSLGKFSSFLKNLLLHARSTIPLQVYEKIQGMRLTQSFNYNNALHNFACSIWHQPDFKPILKDTIPTWYFKANSKSHVFTSTYPGGHILSVDILRGIFLVDGYPPEHLPEDSIYHPLFKTYFQSNRFRVQLDSTGVFTTVDKYREAHYKFLKSGKTLIIRRVGENENYQELLPRQMFENIIPFDLVENFTHWYDSKTGNVKFLRNSLNLNDDEYVDNILVAITATPDSYKFHLRSNHTDSNNMTDTDGEEYFFCITSASFKKLVEGLTQFENENFIHVVKNKKENQITIKLWRHDLSFYWNRNDGLLYSNNFRGFHISELTPGKTSLGTLIGLESFLVLRENISSKLYSKNLVLVPHGFIEINSDRDNPDHKFSSHQSVRVVTTTALRSPSYFSLEVDQVLCRLRPTNEKSAWLYLASLHAATSSPLPDPLTGLTGLEMCMWILQSGMVWSCSPYDQECQATLQFISTLSPRYNFYPDYLKRMQVIETWPKGLEQNSYAVFDGYFIAVKKLLDDSRRLEGLFPDSPTSCQLPKTKEELARRSYFRHINLYNEAAHLTENFLQTSIKPISLEKRCVNSSLRNEVDLVRLAKHRNEMRPWLCDKPSSTPTVAQLILTKEPLEVNDQTTPKLHLQEGISSWLESDLRSNWFHLYKIALMPEYRHEFTLLLGAYLYAAIQETEDDKTIDPNQILLLHNISCFSTIISWPDIPKGIYFEPLKHSPDEKEISSILIKSINKFTEKHSHYATQRVYESAKMQHENEAEREAEKLLKHVMRFWPCSRISGDEEANIIMSYNKISVRTALREINEKLHFWFTNRTLKLFVEEVDTLLKGLVQKLQGCTDPSSTNFKCQNHFCPQLKFEIVHYSTNRWSDDSHLISEGTQNNETFKIASSIFTSGDLTQYLHNHDSTQQQIQDCINLIKKISDKLQIHVTSSKTAEILMAAGIFHRLSPLALIRQHLTNPTKISKVNDSTATISTFTGALAVLWSHLKRLNRILMIESNPSNNSTELEMERQANSQFGCGTEWKPSENPEWLLLQLELDITIRPKQFLVARAMMSASNSAENHVMQLNMGEGKTSVIVPMIVSTISSDPSGGIPRVTVLNSIYTTNLNLLTFAVGGLLNRRIYTVPCRRDLEVQNYIDTIPQIYDECQRLSGVILTLPEYRLSFRLLSYSKFLSEKDQNETGKKIYEVENWLRKNTRDIVDEADEIFGVKFQLIYSTGTQQKITEGNMRWRVCQKLLHLLPSIAHKLLAGFGPNVLEFCEGQSENHPDNFPRIRVLGEECKREFLKLVADSVLNGTVGVCGQVPAEDQPLVKEFLLSSTISKKKHEEFMNLGTISAENRQALLLVSGYLRQGILFEALKKRWRVEYGVNDKADRQGKGAKFMAVPFRAKDVAADRTEFAHPDMAIVLTQLSYYYSGLTDDQLLDCFDLLKNSITAPAAIYNSWIKFIPAEKITQDSIKSLEGVNLQDVEQRTKHVFPLLRRNKLVVDFWLDNVVFPRECKLFPGKLVTNAWDLCYENKTFPTTGFSGTNDTRLLLPAQITQKDIPELVSTNQEIEATLQRAENSYKRSLTMGVKCEEVLTFLRKDKLRVLLDAGAVMLELKNEQIADLWLRIDASLEGVVYFNDGGQMVIRRRSKHDQSHYRTREGNDELLTLSPLKYRLDKCAVYLDDHHTRCTDINLPTNYSACVTVGSGMRRDKLIQACMRMRKLGKGQSVKFYLSHEVDIKIKDMFSIADSNLITVSNILEWTKANSKQFEMDGLYYWAANGKNYAQKLAADMGYEMGKTEGFSGNGKILAECCRDDEVSTVEELYGTYQEPRALAELVHDWFSKVQRNLKNKMPMKTYPYNMTDIEDRIVTKIKKNIGGQLFVTAGIHEEQEKELEFEKEVEAQVERPRSETPNTPNLHSNVKAAVLEPENVQLHHQLDGIRSIGYIFEWTSFWNTVQPAEWGTDKVFATCDFVTVLSPATYGLRKYRKQHLFLRPLSYFVSIQELDALVAPMPQSTKILLLSPFEVNLLIDKIRYYFKQIKKNKYLVTLHMFNGGRWMEDQETFQNNPRLQVPFQNESNGVKLNANLMAPLFVAGGNRFFNNVEEQKAFASFLGLLLKPWEKADEKILQQGQSGAITPTGFVIPGIKATSCFRIGTLFKTDPTGMVKEILKYRFSDKSLRESDHVIRMLDGVSYI